MLHAVNVAVGGAVGRGVMHCVMCLRARRDSCRAADRTAGVERSWIEAAVGVVVVPARPKSPDTQGRGSELIGFALRVSAPHDMCSDMCGCAISAF
jgi:hypothetical protein